ncbi:DUF6538 domain-containing protein [Paracoccus sp. 22332]|uniref:DUF6538 domain-containing protein n=1 Tax=Paracoccus sp. 22332 TaxID=3453913 RepID=UPI003F84E4F9
MVLQMPRPTQRGPGSPFYFLARVPADLVQRLGKREVSYSLQTSDETEAKRRFAAELAKHQARWEAIRKGPQPIPLRTIMALAANFTAIGRGVFPRNPESRGSGRRLPRTRRP